MTEPDKPYVGPRPFQPGEGSLFHGRDTEAAALLSLIIAHPALLLYAQSGAGKTSLLNAKVKPLLEERGTEVLGPSRVSGQLPADVEESEVANIFVFNGLLTLKENPTGGRNFDGKTTLKEYLAALPRLKGPAGGLAQRVLMFDQFEEIFTSSPERWTDRAGFFEQLGIALEEDSLLRVVFAMREEYLASMDNYVSSLPERLRTRFHLERLRYEAALEAVTKPLETTDRHFAPGVAEQLVQNLLRVPTKVESGLRDVSGEFVEPVQLQVVCQNIWNSLLPEITEIDDKFIESSGDVDKALTNYYENCLAQVIKVKPVKEGFLRRWFDTKLITSDGLRSIVYQEDTTAGLPNEVVTMLEDLRLVRAETRGGAHWYELTHDRFIGPIRNSNRSWFATQQGALVGRLLEAKCSEWNKDKRDQKLLSGVELDEAVRWLDSDEAEEFGVSEALRVYVQSSKAAAARSRAEAQTLKARGLRRQRAVLVVLALVAIGSAVFAFSQKRRADQTKLKERSDVAVTMAKQGKRYEALVWALRSVEPSIRGDEAPLPESSLTLRQAVSRIGSAVWQRTYPTAARADLSSDGTRLLVRTEKEVELLESGTGKVIFNNKSGQDATWVNANFSADGQRILIILRKKVEATDSTMSSTSETVMEVWDLEGKPIPVINRYLTAGDFITFSRTGQRALVKSRFNKLGRMLVIDAITGQVVWSAVVMQNEGTLSQSGRLLFANGALWDVSGATANMLGRIKDISMNQGVLFSSDDKKIVLYDISQERPDVRGWDVDSLQAKPALYEFANKDCQLESIDFLSDNKSLIHMCGEYIAGATLKLGKAEVLDTSNGALFAVPEEKLFYQRASDRTLLVALSEEQQTSKVRILNDHGEPLQADFSGLPMPIIFFEVAGDLSRLVTLTKGNVVEMWEMEQGALGVEQLNVKQLSSRACSKLRYQEEELKDSVRDLCRPLSQGY